HQGRPGVLRGGLVFSARRLPIVYRYAGGGGGGVPAGGGGKFDALGGGGGGGTPLLAGGGGGGGGGGAGGGWGGEGRRRAAAHRHLVPAGVHALHVARVVAPLHGDLRGLGVARADRGATEEPRAGANGRARRRAAGGGADRCTERGADHRADDRAGS